jgi:hypothetical protein
MGTGVNRRLVYVATIVTLIGVTAGMAIASGILNQTSTYQSANFYEGGNLGANGYGAAGLNVSTVSTGVTTCSNTPVSGLTSAGTVNVYLSSTTGGTVCTAGDFAEEFNVAFSATISTQTNTFTVTTQIGGGTVQTNSQQVVLGTGTSGPFTQTVDIYVDYGTIQPPATGIVMLDLVAQ